MSHGAIQIIKVASFFDVVLTYVKSSDFLQSNSRLAG